ncbi:hypothetical protein D9M68_848170 [compost metagenome]
MNSSPERWNVPPVPVDEKFNFPGCARAYSTNSLRFFTGSDALISITSGKSLTSPMGVRSLSGS